MKTRLLCTVTVAVSLFLIFFGMRVPNVSKPHSPKPRPRAVVENLIKAGQTSAPRILVSFFDVSHTVLNFRVQVPASASFLHEARHFNETVVKQHIARAPPIVPA